MKLFIKNILLVIFVLLIIFISYIYIFKSNNILINIPGIVGWLILVYDILKKINPKIEVKIKILVFKLLNKPTTVNYSVNILYKNLKPIEFVNLLKNLIKEKYSLKNFIKLNNNNYIVKFDASEFELTLDEDESIYITFNHMELGFRSIHKRLKFLKTLFYYIESIGTIEKINYSSTISFDKNPYLIMHIKDEKANVKVELKNGYMTNREICISSKNIDEHNNNLEESLLIS